MYQHHNTTVQGGVPVTEDFLLKNSSEILKLSNQAKMVFHYLEQIAYLKAKGDQEGTSFLIYSGGLDDVIDSVQDIQTKLQEISNDLCPDE